MKFYFLKLEFDLTHFFTFQLQFPQQLARPGRDPTERVDPVRRQQRVVPVDGIDHLEQSKVQQPPKRIRPHPDAAIQPGPPQRQQLVVRHEKRPRRADHQRPAEGRFAAEEEFARFLHH